MDAAGTPCSGMIVGLSAFCTKLCRRSANILQDFSVSSLTGVPVWILSGS
jgi:hypothetical protein